MMYQNPKYTTNYLQIENEPLGNEVASSVFYPQPTNWCCSSQGHPQLLWNSPALTSSRTKPQKY